MKHFKLVFITSAAENPWISLSLRFDEMKDGATDLQNAKIGRQMLNFI